MITFKVQISHFNIFLAESQEETTESVESETTSEPDACADCNCNIFMNPDGRSALQVLESPKWVLMLKINNRIQIELYWYFFLFKWSVNEIMNSIMNFKKQGPSFGLGF